MIVESLDHLVLTVTNLQTTIRFYTEVLGMTRVNFGAGRMALRFGSSKINLHEAGREIEPKAARATPGSADLCLLVYGDLARWQDHLESHKVAILLGPIERTGATGPLNSLYIRDPDGNLLELSTPGHPG